MVQQVLQVQCVPRGRLPPGSGPGLSPYVETPWSRNGLLVVPFSAYWQSFGMPPDAEVLLRGDGPLQWLLCSVHQHSLVLSEIYAERAAALAGAHIRRADLGAPIQSS